MNKIIKWVLAIFIGLVVVAALAGIGYMVFTHWNTSGWMMGAGDTRYEWDDRALPGQGFPGRGMHPGLGMRGVWGMHGRWFGGFFPSGMLFGGLLQLGILGLIVYGIIALVSGLTRRQQVTGVPRPVAAPQSAPVMHACTNCGYSVREDWKHCPNCGQALTS